ncbi:MAG: hypothetical protein U9R79_17625 [Armatimonadota bacterium]|nr:hypothetical protein [Armatimonadota bacterium]
MNRRMLIGVMMLGTLAVASALPALGTRRTEPMELLEALDSGTVEAVFYGNGDQSVRGRLRRGAFGPDEVYVAPGTQFWAQQIQGQQQRQGMTTIGWVPIDLSRRAYAYVEIPTACTNYNRPAPTRYDRMVPVPCPDRRMAAVSEYVGRVRPSRPAAQLAVWAIANDPPWDEVAEYLEDHAEGDTEQERAEVVAAYRAEAAALMRRAGFDPASFRIFRH